MSHVCAFCGGDRLELVHDEEGSTGCGHAVDRFYECRDCGAETVTRDGRDPELAIKPKDLDQVSDLLHELRSA